MMRRSALSIGIASVLVTLGRLAYGIWWSPYEIVGDEAQYWEWSRRLDWSYFEHGPGIAWLIAAATRVFGTTLWAIRLPSAVCGALTMVAVAMLARSGSPARERVAWVAAALVLLVPAYQLTFLLMTPDAPYLACWSLGAWAAWRALQGEREARPVAWAWLLAGSCVGIGMLFNYAAVMLAVGVGGFMWTSRTRVDWTRVTPRLVLAALAVAFWTIPLVIWNVQHRGAALAQVFGYLRLPGGIWPSLPALALAPQWTLAYVSGTVGIIGPAVALMWMGAKGRRDDHARWLVWCAVPLLLVFLLVSLRTRIEGNWPLPAFLSLAALAARTVAEPGAPPAMARWMKATVAYGVVAGALIHAPLVTARLPGIGRFVPLARFSGIERAVEQAAPAVQAFLDSTGRNGLIIAASHNAAAQLAFYLPGHPTVASAGRFLGARLSSYDFFADTALTPELLRGKRALLAGGALEQWETAFDFDALEVLEPPWLARVDRIALRQAGPADGVN